MSKAIAGNALHLTIIGMKKTGNVIGNLMHSLKEFGESDKPGALMDMIDALAGADMNPITTFMDMSGQWLQAGAADAMEGVMKIIFSEENVTLAQEVTTEFGRLASEGLANILTEINKALPEFASLALAVWGIYLQFGKWGLILAAVTAAIQWVTENWPGLVAAMPRFLDGLKSWWEDYSWLFPFGSGGWIS